jgi:alpha-tubulin suppressor-like RCC1 family protein
VAPLPAQVSGDSTITATALGDPLTIKTSNQYAGAISSLRWRNKEFVNDFDHGRQIQSAFSAFNRYECYNAYEAGSLSDGPTSSSRVLSLTASGNKLDGLTQMCWYTHSHDATPGDHCGDPNYWLPCPQYNGPLSDYLIHKTVTIGYAGMSNVIEYLSDLWIPEVARKGEVQTVVAVMPYEFANLWTYDIVSKNYRKIRAIGGEDDGVKVLATADGAYALGYYSPELLQPYVTSAGGFRWGFALPDPVNYPDPTFACAGFGGIDRFDTFNGPGYRSNRSYLVIGNMDQVKSTLSDLHYQFRTLDPDVFNWRDYVSMNQLQAALPDQGTAEAHWINHGIPEGRTASKSFSPSQYLQLNPDLANVLGATNYQGAIDHYISSGRSEGRSTVAKPAGGMQHLLVFTNRIVNASGQNAYGQLGTSTSPSPPTHIVSLDNTVTEVAAADYTSFAVKNDGSLWVWGSNQYGARGDGTSGDNIDSPVQVPIPNLISTPTRRGKHAVAVGTGVYAAIDTEGRVWTWGVNWNGRLGNGSTTSRYTPARVQKSANPGDYLTGVVSITAGGGTLAALDADGNVWTWGAGANGALGNGFMNDSSYPVQLIDTNSNTPLGGVTEVACGSSGFCIALARYGTVFGWGSNAFSQLGFAGGGFRSLATPINVGPYSSIDAIAAGSAHCIAHSTDGNVYGWGYNGRGQLGTGSTGVAQSTPVVMKGGPDNMNDISDLAAGGNFSIMVRNSDRAVFVTGDNQSGQLGIPGNQSTQSLPVRSSF